MAGLCVLLLLVLGSEFLSQAPAAIYAIPAPDISRSETKNNIEKVPNNYWDNIRNIRGEKDTSQPCVSQYGSWDCSDKKSGSEDMNINMTLSHRPRDTATIVKDFSTDLWNKTKHTAHKVEEKSKKWWKTFTGFFSGATTPKPPSYDWMPGSIDVRGKRAANPCVSEKDASSTGETPCK